MAQLDRDIRLTIGQSENNPSNQLARVRLTVDFTENEVQANSRYLVQAFLYEKDDDRDFVVMKTDGTPQRLPLGKKDNRVGTIGKRWIRPDGNKKRGLTLEEEWNFPELDDNIFQPAEQFYAAVTIVPEMAIGDLEISPIVTIDIG